MFGPMKKPEPEEELEVIVTFETPEEKVYYWRFYSFLELGFDPDTAELLATERTEVERLPVSIRQTESLLKAGCPLHLAVQIVL